MPTKQPLVAVESATATATPTETAEPTGGPELAETAEPTGGPELAETATVEAPLKATGEPTVVKQPTETPVPPAEDVVSREPVLVGERQSESDAGGTPVVASTDGSGDGDGGNAPPAAHARDWTPAAVLPVGLLLLVGLAGAGGGRLVELRRRADGGRVRYPIATTIPTSSGAAD